MSVLGPWGSEATIIPNYVLMSRRYLNLYDTYQAQIFPFLASVFSIFLLRQHFLGIPKELHDASPTNRDFLAARFLTDKVSSGTRSPVEAFRHRIRAVFNIDDNKLDLAGGRKTIREYLKATGDLAGTVDLMLTYVEAGTEFTNEFDKYNSN